MPTLLPELTSFSVKKRARSIIAVHHTPIENAHCSPPTTNTFSPSFIKSFMSLMLVIGLFANLVRTTYDSLGRRIETSAGDNKINYYYDPEVEFLEPARIFHTDRDEESAKPDEARRAMKSDDGCVSTHCPRKISSSTTQSLGFSASAVDRYEISGLSHCVNGSRIWNLYGLDRSGTYGGAQGIGGLESTYNESTDITYDHVKNVFGDTVGIYTDNQAAPYVSVLGGYGPMLGSSVNGDLCPQWRGHYLDPTGFYYMGARYYDPVDGRFLSADPLGHGSSLSLYDYCNGDPVNGLDPDGRCVENIKATATHLGNKYINYSMSEIARQWDESESINNNLSQGNYRLAAQQYLSHVGPSLIATIVPEGKPIGAVLEGAYYLAQESAPIIKESSLSSFPLNYQGGPGAMWREEVNGMPNPYKGVQEASQYLQEMEISHDFRKQILESFDINTIQIDKATSSEFGIRYFDNINATAEGHYLFETFPASRMSLSLQSNWNKMKFLKQYQIRPGAMFLKGRASLQGPYLPGGQMQKYIINKTDLLP